MISFAPAQPVSLLAAFFLFSVCALGITLPSAPGYIGTFDAPGIAVLVAFNVPQALASIRHPELRALEGEVSYFLGRETLLATSAPGMAKWRQGLFALMSRNAQNAMTFFKLPPDRVVEVGVQVEL